MNRTCRSFILLCSFLIVAMTLGVVHQKALAVSYVYLDGQPFLQVGVPDTIDVTADCAQAGNRLIGEVFLDINENGTVDGSETVVQFVYINDGIPTLENDQGDEIPGDDDAQENGLLLRRLELLGEDYGFSTVPVQFLIKITDQDRSTAQAILRVLPSIPGQPYIGGMVTAEGTAVPLDSMVVVAYESNLDEQRATVTDEGGRYVLDVEAGDWTVRAWDLTNYYASGDSQLVSVLAQDSAVADFVLGPYPAYITGKVDSSGGQPVPGILVAAVEGLVDFSYAWTRLDGTYRMGVTPGTYDIYPLFLPSGYACSPASYKNVPVDSGMTVANKKFRLGHPAGRIEGRVTYQAGGGAPGVTINAYSIPSYYYSTTTDADGNYSLAVFPAQYLISAQRQGYEVISPPNHVYLFVTVSADQPATGNDFIIAPGGGAPASISGTITYQASGEPASGVYAVIFKDDENSPLGWSFTETDGSGFYEFGDIAPGTWLIGAYEPGNSADPPLREQTVSLGGPPATGQDFELVAATEVAVGMGAEMPLHFNLLQNRPNPFNAETIIAYTLSPGRPERVTLKIFNVLGQKVRTLVDEVQEAGLHLTRWDGLDRDGLQAASGIYFCELQAGGQRRARKLVLLR